MNNRQEGSPDLTGVLAVLASAFAVVLVGVATITDRPVLLSVAALAVAAAITLVILRRSAARRLPGPVSGPAPATAEGPDHHHGVATDVGTDVNGDGDGDGDQRYRDEAIAARADLLATLRHGFRSEAVPEPGLDTDPGSFDAPASPEGQSTAPSPTEAAPWSFPDRPSATPSAPDPSAPDAASDPLFDPATGLFTQGFFQASLPKRVSAARRGLRPLSLAVVDVVVGRPVAEATAADRAVVAAAMTQVFRDADTIAITDNGQFLVLLEDTPEAGAVWTLERLRRHLTAKDPDHTMWAGVSCYPAYSFDADGLIVQASEALESARQWQQDRIEIAAHGAE